MRFGSRRLPTAILVAAGAWFLAPSHASAACDRDGACEDGEACPGCVDCCVCDPDEPDGPDLEASFAFESSWNRPMPFFRKTLGWSLAVQAEAMVAGPRCDSGCVAERSARGRLTGEVLLPGNRKVGFNGGASWSVADDYCEACVADACPSKECTELSCSQQTLDGDLSVSTGWQWGLPGLGFERGPVTFDASCSVAATIEGRLSASAISRTPGVCEPCTACDERTASVTVPIEASGSCGLTFGLWGHGATLGCDDCVQAGVEVAGDVSRTQGACRAGARPEGQCVRGRASIWTAFDTGPRCAGIGWWKVGATCSGVANAWCEADSCGPESCDTETELECTVLRGSAECGS